MHFDHLRYHVDLVLHVLPLQEQMHPCEEGPEVLFPVAIRDQDRCAADSQAAARS